jgi:hypothetical protein
MKKPEILPSHYYGDPANVVKFENETCKGCLHARFSSVVPEGWCHKKKKFGLRCELYKKDISNAK